MRVVVKQTAGANFVATNDDGSSLRMEGSADLGGRGEALRPMEAVLAALGGCSAVDVVKILGQQREPLEGLEVEIVGTRADATPAVFTEITMRFIIRGPVAENKARRAVALSAEKYCSVAKMLEPTVKIAHEVVLDAAPAGSAGANG
jgi:putative redox protein